MPFSARAVGARQERYAGSNQARSHKKKGKSNDQSRQLALVTEAREVLFFSVANSATGLPD
jgi:hypothetical protein